MATQTLIPFSSLPHPLIKSNPFKFKSKTLTLNKHPITTLTTFPIITSKLRVAVIGGGPAGSSAAEALASSGGIDTYIFERSPSAAKPCGGAIPLCMLDEFSIPDHLIDRKVTKMTIISPSNLAVDFGKTLRPHEFISMVRREVLDSFLRHRAEDRGANLVKALVTRIDLPVTENSPYLIHYISNNNTPNSLAVDVVIGADGANSKVAKAIDAGDYNFAIAFQERIKLPEEKMQYYSNLAEMYVGSDVSPDFYAWVFPKCDHVAVGTGTARSRKDIKQFQRAIRNRARSKLAGGETIKIEAHPLPEHPRPRRVRGRAALVGDAAGYVTKCAGEGIYFAAKSGRMCGEAIVRASENGVKAIGEEDLRREYLRKWDREYMWTYKFLDVLQRVFYGRNAGWEALVELCGEEYVQRMTFESYLYKRMAKGKPWEDLRLGMKTVGSLIRCNIIGKEMVENYAAGSNAKG